MDNDRARALRKLAKRLGVTFVNLDILDQALIQPSHKIGERLKGDNDRFEFIGDRLWAAFVGMYLLKYARTLHLGAWSRLQSTLTSAKAQLQIAQDLQVDRCLSFQAQHLQSTHHNALKIEEQILVDALEAIVTAVVLDQGLDAGNEFVERLLRPVANPLIAQEREALAPPRPPKQELEARVRGLGFRPSAITYSVTQHLKDLTGNETFHVLVFVNNYCRGKGVGTDRYAAEDAAAEEALKNTNLVSQTPRKRTASR